MKNNIKILGCILWFLFNNSFYLFSQVDWNTAGNALSGSEILGTTSGL